VTAGYAVLGMGRLGTSLAAALSKQGAPVLCWRRSPGGPGNAGEWGSDTTVALDPLAAAMLAGTVVIAVPDDSLLAFAQGLAAADWSGRNVVHCSGRMGAEPLAPLAAQGAVTAAAHPVMTFAGHGTSDRLGGIGWGVTAADPAGLAMGFAFAEALGGRPFAVAAEARALYHAALAHAINHLGVLAVEAGRLLALSGAPDPAAVLAPAMEAALAGALARGSAAATGPVVRGDAGTLAAHRRAIREAAPESWPPYAALATAGIAQALAAGRVDAEQAERLRAALTA
jgi:predicted short-subunit dehydrogenase-like oxidoreductase (DUF2520 family)